MTPEPTMPPMVFTIWHVTVLLALVLFVPLAVYWLHSLWRASASIRRYARDSAAAAEAIRANTAALPALDDTIRTAGAVLAAAESVAGRLEAIAAILEARAAGRP